MRRDRYNEPQRRHPFLTGLLCVAVAGAAALGIAFVWQNAQEEAAPEVSDSAESRQRTGTYDSEPVPLHSDSVPENEPSRVVAQESDAESAPVPESDIESESVPPPEEESSESDAADAYDGTISDASSSVGSVGFGVAVPIVFEGAVPESAKVDASYFDDAIFFGDSISTGIPLYHIADNAAVVAVTGVSPGTALESRCVMTADGRELTLLDAAKEKGARAKVYVMLGGNGLWMDLQSFINGYRKFIGAVKDQYPDAVIYIQSMTPATTFVEREYPSVTNAKIIEYNTAIAELAKECGVYFVNVFEALAGPDGFLPNEASSDGLHLTPEYYVKWFEYLKTHTVKG